LIAGPYEGASGQDHLFLINREEISMVDDGYHFGRYSSRSAAQKLREATPEDRATYRKWLRGTITFYLTVFLISGAIGALNYFGVGLTQLPRLAARQIVQSPHWN
jgi:hypothetical protein